MEKTHCCDLDQCCEKYKEQFADFLKSMAITKATPENNLLYISERNQGAYFFYAVKSVYPEATAWFEFPFDERKHLDVLIFIPKSLNLDHKQVLLVESKNMRTLSTKAKEMIADVRRIGLKETQEAKALKSQLKTMFDDFNEISFYGVILCDVQKTGRGHVNFADQWEKGDMIKGYFSLDNEQEDRDAITTWIGDSTTKKLSQTISDESHGKEPIQYEQLIRYWPIKNEDE